MTTGRRTWTEKPEKAEHLAFRKQLWKKALATGVASLAEIRQAALDPQSQTLLLASLRLAGIQVTP